MKKIIILILIVLIGLGVYFFVFKEAPKEEVTPNTDAKLIEDKVIDNVLISNIAFTNKNDKTVFSAKITNLTANQLTYKNLQIIVKDKNNKKIATLISYFGEILEPEETKIVTAQTDKALKNIASVEFILNK